MNNVENDLLRRLLYQMTRIRMVEQQIASEYAKQEMRCPTHLSIGQEANAAVVGAILTHEDLAVSTHRAHAHYLAKGGDLNAMIAELFGRSTGCCEGRGGSMHLVDREAGFVGSTAILGGSIPVGAGLGLSLQLAGSNRLACVFLGDGATEEGVFWETVNFAVVRSLPVLFICENNLYSVYSPLFIRQPAEGHIFERVAAMGMKSRHYEGSDVLELYDHVSQIVADIRQGKGPRFIEIATYRWLEHCGPNSDNHLGYRSEDEFETWKAGDPLNRLEARLLEAGALGETEWQSSVSGIQEEIAKAFDFARQSTFPSHDDGRGSVYRELREIEELPWLES